MIVRPRRLRGTAAMRSLVRETCLQPTDFVYPMFVRPGHSVREPIVSMPGINRYSPDTIAAEAEAAWKDGIRSVLLFGLAGQKDDKATEAYAKGNVVVQAIESIRKAVPEMVVMTDVCVCGYTAHGHCGIVEDGKVENDKSLKLLAQMALTHAQAGAHVVAPSAMMDGQVEAIRSLLDKEGFGNTAIMAYAAKFYSAWYGPFRDAADSAPQWGDRASYQMDMANVREAMREVEQDELEGADIIMIKPGMLYLDIVRQARQHTHLPIAAYNVSGEYSSLMAAAERGWLDKDRAMMEMMYAFKRAGCDLIITYFARQAAQLLNQNK